MKESQLFLQFLRRNFLIFFLPVLISAGLSVFFYSAEKAKTKISQSFRIEYSQARENTAFAFTDQAVTELRLQSFDNLFPGSKASIYKPGPLTVSIEVISEEKNAGYELLLKETEYLRKNFTVSTLTQPEITQIEPSFFRFFLTGILLGFLAGLLTALFKEYLQNF